MIRQIVLDTETTGLSWEKGNRVVEIGAIEIIERRPTGRRFQRYLNPDREMEPGAQEITGLSLSFLADKPRFGQIVEEFLEFIRGAELVIHNASFDIGFLDAELARLDNGAGRISDRCSVLDTLAMARERYPGQRNSLDALCKRLGVDNSRRDLHGGLIDAQLLADVYLAMTTGQGAFELGFEGAVEQRDAVVVAPVVLRVRPRVLHASADELLRHEQRLDALDKSSADGQSVWRRQG